MKYFAMTPARARLGMAIASLLGLFAAGYLFYTYVSGAPIACGLVSGCEAVRASKWATSFGLPRPFWGLVFYALMFATLVIRAATLWQARRLYRLTVLLAVIGFIESAVLFGIQWLDIKAFCIWCLASAIMATLIALFAIKDQPSTDAAQGQLALRRYFIGLLIFLPFTVIAFLWLIKWHQTPATGFAPMTNITNDQTRISTSSSALALDKLLLLPETVVEGPTSSNVLVVEFMDFQCPACGAFAPSIKRLRQEYRGQIRFAYRLFPLSQLHDHALDAARAAVCARDQGKFFPFADAMFEQQDRLAKDELIKLAKRQGLSELRFRACLDDAATIASVERDQAAGFRLGVQFTPTLFVNRIKADQAIPYQDLKKLIDQQLSQPNI